MCVGEIITVASDVGIFFLKMESNLNQTLYKVLVTSFW